MADTSVSTISESSAPVATSFGRAGMDDAMPDFVLRDRWRPNYRAREVKGRMFLSSEQGSWTVLTHEEYSALRSIALPRHLYQHLEERGLIITDRNSGCVMRAYKEWTSGYFLGTSLHIMGMTRRCNLRCTYCHSSVVPAASDPAKFDMDQTTARTIVDFAFQSPSERMHFEFQGGESSLNFGVVRYIQSYATLLNLKHRRKLSFSMVTNGVNLSDEALDYLQAAGIGVTTSVELSGSDEPGVRVDWNNQLHREDVEDTRRRLAIRGIYNPMLIVIARNNLHRMRAYIDKAVETGQSSLFFSPVQRVGFAKGAWRDIGISIDEFFEHYRDAMDYIFELWDQGILVEERYFSLAIEKLFSERDTRYMDYRNPNGMVLGDLAYDHRGDIYACDEGRGHPDFRIGNVFRDTYRSVINSDRARQLVSYSLREHPECQLCGYKPFCGVSPIVSKGESDRLDPQPLTHSLCQRTLHLFDYINELMVDRPTKIDQALAIIGFARG
jgi:radical SAM protein with 4Fe4S-binding SPASM domain